MCFYYSRSNISWRKPCVVASASDVPTSKACKDAVDKQISLEGISEDLAALNFEERPEDFLTTSKGEEHSYEEVGGRTFVVRSYVY